MERESGAVTKCSGKSGKYPTADLQPMGKRTKNTELRANKAIAEMFRVSVDELLGVE